MRLPFLRLPEKQDTESYAFCEPVWATTFSKIHIRLLGEQGRRLGGGIDSAALCGRSLAGGWDLGIEVDRERVRAGVNAPVNPLCWECADVWLALP